METSSQLLNLLAASAVFIALHRIVSGTPIRARIVARLSEHVFLRAFALASALSLAWLVLAYAAAHSEASNQRLFVVSPTFQLLQFPLQLAAVLLVVFGLTTPSPTVAGQGQSVREPDIRSGSAAHHPSSHPVGRRASRRRTHVGCCGPCGLAVLWNSRLRRPVGHPQHRCKASAHVGRSMDRLRRPDLKRSVCRHSARAPAVPTG